MKVAYQQNYSIIKMGSLVNWFAICCARFNRLDPIG
jgi:hypothetical protein